MTAMSAESLSAAAATMSTADAYKALDHLVRSRGGLSR